MTDFLEFSINEITYEILAKEKKKDRFEEKSWDNWFQYRFSLHSKIHNTHEKIDDLIPKALYENQFDMWVTNFALNLNNIWKENSARILDPTINTKNTETKNSAIVIGRGPSLKKHNHLEILAKSDYRGSIICTDGILIKALEAGVTPDKFPKFYVVTIDGDDEIIRSFYDSEIVDLLGSKINAIFSTLAHPSVVNRARKAGMTIHWLHTLFDYHEGKKSFNRLAGLMVRAKKNSTGLPAIQTGGNVGTSSWFIAWQILKCNTIALIGINHGWEEDDPSDLIMSHGNAFDPPKINKESENFKKLFPKIYNPEFNTFCILDPVFQYYSSALKEFISRSPPTVNTINATEGGCIFGDRITCLKFEKFLKLYSR